MKEFETDYIEKLIDIMKNNEITEVTLEDEEKSLVIKGGNYTPVVKEKIIESTAAPEAEKQESAKAPVEEKKNLVPVISTMIGSFYIKPSPDKPDFVKVGDRVKEGQTVCLIETIKLMNKVVADVSGKITEICLENGKPVEYGQVMMYIEKD